uniref:Uncharacterized protein n=1 Tax=Panagrellus redivivus TaxID=6233 RepID=A0A7E4ZR09_PANRE
MQLAAAEGDARAHTCKKQLEQRPKASLTATNLRTVAVRRGHFDRCILLYIVPQTWMSAALRSLAAFDGLPNSLHSSATTRS